MLILTLQYSNAIVLGGFENTLKVLITRMASLPTQLRTRSLNCMEGLFRVTDVDNRITSLVRKWFGLIGEQPMDWLVNYAQNPFSEIRLAGLGVLSALSSHYWGQENIRNTPGLCFGLTLGMLTMLNHMCVLGLTEFLMDRQCETDKDCKLAKYDIVRILSTSSVFDHATQSRMQTFVREGPFYVEAVTEVAIEGD